MTAIEPNWHTLEIQVRPGVTRHAIFAIRVPDKYNKSSTDVLVSALGGTKELRQQRAQLMAAAPELARVLKVLVDTIRLHNSYGVAWTSDAEKALRKAGVT